MSIRELTCPAHGHPVGPDDAYCGACGAPVSAGPVRAMHTWPKIVPVTEPAQEPMPAVIIPIRPPVEFKPLDFTEGRPQSRRRVITLLLAIVATVASVALLVTSEVMLGNGNNRAVWSVMWLIWYAATVLATAGWFYVFIHWVRNHRARQAPGD